MSDYVSCPECGSSDVGLCKFTWWGGVVGPKLLTHVKCVSCGKKFNGKTGQSNTRGIVIYTIVVFVILFVVFFALGLFINAR